MCRTFDETLDELRIMQAYIEVFSNPGTRMIRVMQMGNYEIRILRLSQSSADREPAIWMELFDQTTESSVDSSRCREIEHAPIVFREFVAQIRSG
jgi:hypothetical protein